VERIDYTTPEQEAALIMKTAREGHLQYRPYSFWWFQPTYYVQMVVEKIDLKSLFGPTCEGLYVPIANSKGWSDLNLRADMMRRFAEADADGKICVLLYCGDHDPVGIRISDSLRKNMKDLAEAVGWDPGDEDEGRLIIDRFGLNYEFIQDNNLTWIDNLITGTGRDLADPSHEDHWKPHVQNYLKRYGARKVEANALVKRPKQGRDLCREAILKYIDFDAVTAFEEAMEQQRQEVAALVARLMKEAE
jgi:hypothetical protein